MKIVTDHEFMKLFCSITGQYCMHINMGTINEEPMDGDPDEYLKAAPYLSGIENELQVLANESAFIVAETKEEIDHYFQLTVGDDGPTKLNPYDGPARVYALTCGPEGLLNENT